MRRAAKIDRNQPEIVKALEQIGCSVQSLAAVGAGVPDLLVGFRGQTIIMEIKDGKKPPSQSRLRPKQVMWHEWWLGQPVWLVKSVDDAIEAVNHATR